MRPARLFSMEEGGMRRMRFRALLSCSSDMVEEA